MAAAQQHPVVDAAAGVAALDEDIPRVLRVLGASSIEALGWSRPNKLSLLIPIRAAQNGRTDDFVLRLGFQAYRSWPPSALFINPGTGRYDYPRDTCFVPRLTSPECRTHTAYARSQGGTTQLVCCSATLEFYEVLHDVKPEHVWQSTNTFYTTIVAIERAMASFYEGRFAENGQ